MFRVRAHPYGSEQLESYEGGAMVRWYRFWAVMGGAALMLASPWAVGTASAEPPSQNCVYDLQPVDPLQTSGDILTVPVQQGCYSTYSHAVAAGSSQGSTRGNDSLLPAADVLIGTEWVNRFFGGNSNSYFASDTCSSNVSWSVAYVGDQWNDVFSSGKGFGGCNTNKKFQDASFGGSVLTCTPNCNDYGSLSNEVSSLKWKP